MSSIITPGQTLPLDGLATWLFEVAAASASILLSALLVALYWRMYRVQKSQSDVQRSQVAIMDVQTKIMAASYTPDLVVEELSADGDEVEVLVSNRGRGRAKNFRICCQPYVSDHGGGHSFAWVAGVPLRPSTSRLSCQGDGGSNDSELYRGVVELEAFGDSSLPFSEAVGRIDRRGPNPTVGVELYLVYESEIGERFVQRLVCANDFDVGPEVSIEEALRTRSSDAPIIETVSYDRSTVESNT